MGALDGRVALVTGAGRLRGIGRATAVALAEMGADVVVTGTGRDPATFPEDEKQAGWRDIESTAEQIHTHGRRALTWVGDVSRAEVVRSLVDLIMQTFGRVDVLVNNAAYPRGNDRVAVPDLDEAVWRKVLDIKLTGTFLLCQRIVPIMTHQQWGRIINFSSVFGKRGPLIPPHTARQISAFRALHKPWPWKWRVMASRSTPCVREPSTLPAWTCSAVAWSGSSNWSAFPWDVRLPTKRWQG